MNSRVAQIDTGAGVSFIVSAVIHLAVFLLLAWWGQQFPQQMTIQETYYVDVVNMPANAPQSGGSTQKPGESAAVPPTPVAAPVMAIPSKVKKLRMRCEVMACRANFVESAISIISAQDNYRLAKARIGSNCAA